MTKRINNKGFTLVELLVVIAIIAVLAGVLVVAINPAALLMKARDATRLQDLEAVEKSLNLALADSEITLATVAETTATAANLEVDGTGWVSFTVNAGKTGLAKYLPTLPLDPSNTGAYVYSYASDGTGFELNTVLESPDNVAKMSTDGGDEAGVYETGSDAGLDIISAT